MNKAYNLIAILLSSLLCAALNGCYSPIMNIQSITVGDYNKNHIHARITDERLPIIFYKECSRNGSAWLYECQSIGLQSIQQAISLYRPNYKINDIEMFFYPKKSYIRFEVYDRNALQD